MLAEYHLRVLERHGLVSVLEEEQHRRFFPKVDEGGFRRDVVGTEDKRWLALLRHPVRLHLLTYLAYEGEARNRDLARELGLSRPATTYQLGKLQRAGAVVKGATGRFTLTEPERVRALLLRFRPPDDAVERFRSLWEKFTDPGDDPDRVP